MRKREIRIKEDRILYALDKKLLKNLGWTDKDSVSQITFGYDRIMLFNESQNKRISKEDKKKKIDKGFLEFIGQLDFKGQKEWRELQKKNTRKGKIYPKSKEYQKDVKQFNKEKLYEEDLKEYQLKFNLSAEKENLKNLAERKNFVKKSFRKLISLIEKDPLKAIRQVDDAQLKREEKINKEIEESKKIIRKLKQKLENKQS